MLMQQPLRDLDQIRAFMSSMGPTAFLDMPWIPVFLIGLFLFHPLIGLDGGARNDGNHRDDAVDRTTVARRRPKAAMDTSAQRQVLADATQRNAEVVRALGMTARFGGAWSRSQ